MLEFVFDMDGTIVDSRRATREAYKRVGIDMPDHAWGKTAAAWNCPPEVHEMKTRLYPTILLRLGRRLHAADLLKVTNGSILTGASEGSVNAVRKFLKHDFPLTGAGCDHDAKLATLSKKAQLTRVFYVDDDLDFGKRVLDEIPNTVFMHVARHEGVYHIHSQGLVQRWTLSSWLPDVTIV